ncbi:MAG: D-alanine--D-alanine ligase [candidate division Zixibacteria bacterium]|nr:D-alanine--D-alanine ligase [candidate division Zixibacteria bacterium]
MSHPSGSKPNSTSNLRVLVLAGGRSSERDVSLATGAAVSRGLHDAGFHILTFDPVVSPRAIPWSPDAGAASIDTTPPDQSVLASNGNPMGTALTPQDLAMVDLKSVDLVFIALHGGDGENGRLQALLDLCGVRYTGSGMMASALAMDKHAAKRIFTAEGIPTPRWFAAEPGMIPTFDEVRATIGLPLIIKPSCQGSTVGLSLVRDESQWDKALSDAFVWDQRVLIEEFIAGRELTVGVLGGQTMPVVEIIPTHEIYDYECKYTSGRTQYICPADLTPEQADEVQRLGLDAFNALGCQGYARTDFRMSKDGRFFCLEVNTLPGMTSLSLVPKAARTAGIEFPDLLKRICQLALEPRP